MKINYTIYLNDSPLVSYWGRHIPYDLLCETFGKENLNIPGPPGIELQSSSGGSVWTDYRYYCLLSGESARIRVIEQMTFTDEEMRDVERQFEVEGDDDYYDADY